MFRGLLFLSLLHLGASAELHNSAEYVQGAMKSIGDSLTSVKVPGTARQIAINALLKNVQGSEKLTPGQVDILNNITTLLEDILNDLGAQVVEDQNEMNTFNTHFSNCNTAGVADDGNFHTTATDRGVTHHDCRDTEKTLFDDDSIKCSALISWLTALGSPDCVKPEPTQDRISEWTTFLSQGLSWFENNKNAYVPKRNACTTSTTALEAQNTLCNQAQANYETAWCVWASHRVQMCNTLDTCWTTQVNAHTTLAGAMTSLSTQRIKEVIVIKHVICLINKLVEGVADIEAECPLEAEDDSALDIYRVNDIIVPDKASCNRDEVLPSPGDAGWTYTLPTGLSAQQIIPC